MLRFYPIIVIIQAFCLYHAYSNKSDQKWYWLIILLPFIGSMIYLYDHFYSRNNVDKIKEGLKETLVSNYAINKLESKVKFSDTLANKLELASEHIKIGNLDRAIDILKSSDSTVSKNNPSLNALLMKAYYQKEDYAQAIKYGTQLTEIKEFKKSNELIDLAWSYSKIGNQLEAELIFQQMDSRYSNYNQRLEYAYFLKESNQMNSAIEKVNNLMDEISEMDSYEMRLNKQAIRGIKYLSKEIC